jgi:hypothetical protein
VPGTFHAISYLAPTIPVHAFSASVHGPTAIIQAGIHGDEVAGVHALEELLEEGLAPKRGRLVIIPVMNPPAYRARARLAPGGLDLNRSFPGDAAAPEREKRLAHAFMELVLAERPALLATLHESWKRYHPEIPVSFGQTIVYGVEPRPPVVDRVVAAMNAHLESPYERWAPHYFRWRPRRPRCWSMRSGMPACRRSGCVSRPGWGSSWRGAWPCRRPWCGRCSRRWDSTETRREGRDGPVAPDLGHGTKPSSMRGAARRTETNQE